MLCDVFDGIFLCFSFFPLDVLDEIWDLIESDSEGFPTYYFIIWRHSHRSQITLSAEGISYNIARQVKLTPDAFGFFDTFDGFSR